MTQKKAERRSSIVTGGGTGIGFAIAEVLVRTGHDVTIIGRRRNILDEAAIRLRAVDPAASVLVCDGDLADTQFAEAAIMRHCEASNRLDTLVCCAGIQEQVHTLEMTAAVWDRAMDANVRGHLLMAVAAARWMNAHGGGRIIFIGSVLMDQSEPLTLAYSASKATLASIVRSMAVDLADTQVFVNGVAPGWVATTMTEPQFLTPEQMVKVNPQRRAGDPAEIAEVVRYLAMEAPRYLTGQMIVVDGGQTIRGATNSSF